MAWSARCRRAAVHRARRCARLPDGIRQPHVGRPSRRRLRASQTDAAQRPDPTAKCGTTNQAESCDQMFAAPSASWTRTRTSMAVTIRRGRGRSVARRTRSERGDHEQRHHQRERAVQHLHGLLAGGDVRHEAAVHEREVRERETCSWPVTHDPSSICAKTATAVSQPSGVRRGCETRRAGNGPWAARSAMKIVAASTVSAIARCGRSRDRPRSPSMTTASPEDRLHDDEHPAAIAAARSGRSRRLSRAQERPDPDDAPTSGPTKSAATSRWLCSIQALSSRGGIQSLNAAAGPVGQPSPESVARTRPPTR